MASRIDITSSYSETSRLVDEHINSGKFDPNGISTPREYFTNAAVGFTSIRNNLGSEDAGSISQKFVNASIRLLCHNPEYFKHWRSLGTAIGTVATKISPEAGDEAFNNVISTKAFAGALGYQKKVFFQHVQAACASSSSTHQLAHHEQTHL